MAYYNFLRLISKYSTDFIVYIPAEGKYDDNGEYVQGEVSEISLRGAIIAMSESKIYRSEGTLTTLDKSLYMNTPIDFPLKGATVVHDGKKYNIESERENSKFTDVWEYTLKYVSAFDMEAMADD